MKNTLRRAAALFMALLLAAGSSACGAGKEQAETAVTETPEEKKTESVSSAEQESPAASEPRAEEPKTEEKTEAEETAAPLRMVIEKNQVTGYAEDPYYTRYRLNCSLVRPAESTADRYPELYAALEEYNDDARSSAEDTGRMLDGSADSFFEMNPSAKEENGSNLYSDRTPYILRADTNVVSILYYHEDFTGGLHPNWTYEGVNIATATGKKLQLDDVITDPDTFASLIDEKLKEKYPEEYPQFFTDPVQAVKDSAVQDGIMAWTLGYEGMTVYFSPYTLGAYAMGGQNLTVFYDEAPELFAPEYTKAAADYIVPIFNMTPPEVDAAGTGKREEVRVETISTDEYGGCEFVVHRGNGECRLNICGYGEKSFLVKSGGKYYAYVLVTSDNDYVLLYTVDLMTLSMPDTEGIPADEVLIRFDGTNTDGTSVFMDEYEAMTDPAGFRLDSYIDYLSTMRGNRMYHTGENGCPVADEDVYTIQNNRALRVLQPVTVETVAEDGTVTGSKTLEPDTYLFFIRTDNETYMDMQAVDASLVTGEDTEWYSSYEVSEIPAVDWSRPVYRIREDKSDWPYTVDGIEENQAFAGIIYAG